MEVGKADYRAKGDSAKRSRWIDDREVDAEQRRAVAEP